MYFSIKNVIRRP